MRRIIYILILLCPGIARAYTSPQISCLMNLRQIESAKGYLQLEKRLPDGAACSVDDLKAYLPNKVMPHCPLNGSYTIGPLGALPACSIPTHSQAAFDEAVRAGARRQWIVWPAVIGGACLAAGLIFLLLRKSPSANKSLHSTPR